MGKIPSEIARRAALQGVETLAIGGLVDQSADSVSKDVFKDILAIQPAPTTQKEMSEAMNPETAKANIRKTISRYFAENI